MSRSWAGGSTRAWRSRRSLVYANQGRVCVLRLEGCTGWADQVHHTRGRAASGDDPRYLVPACGPCNRRAGDPMSGAADDPSPAPRTQW